MRSGGDGGELGDDAMREDLAVARVMDIHGVVIERRHRRHHRRHHRHGMRVVVEAVEEAQQRLVEHGVVTDVAGELLELLRRGELSEQQQVGDLHEGALFRELLDRVAAIQQHARIPVDVGDAALGRGGRAEARIVGEHIEVFVKTCDIERRRPDGAGAHRQVAAAPAGAIGELEGRLRLAGHVHSRVSVWRYRARLRARHSNEPDLHGPCPESRRGLPAGRGAIVQGSASPRELARVTAPP